MKKLLACTMFCLLSFVLLGATTADAHSIEFNGVSYDYTDMTTTLTYSVTSGTQPALSHWVLEWCTNGEHVLSITGETEYEYGYDQFTKVTGIKFLTGFDDGETKSYTIVLDGIFPLTTINVGFKAANEYTNTTVLGPYAFCGEYSEIGDYVWVDSDKDGIQDAGESGQSGVTVQLFLKTGGNEYKVGEQTTDGSGGYLFTNLAPGTYYVTFSNLPSGYEFTLQDQGGNDTVDSDANPSTGKTIDITLGENESQLQWDAGIKEKEQFGALQVTKTVDWNGVTPDPDKEFTVQIVGPSYPSGDTKTVKDGQSVTWNDLAPGDYTVSEPGVGGEWTVKVTDGEPATVVYGQTAEASITNTHKVGSIGDFVWDDTNRNGIQDAGEPGVEGVTVKLFTTGGVQVGSTQTTDANGGYLFTNVPAGSYYVEFSNIPSGYEFTDSNQGGDDEKDSDADQTTGKTGTITLAAGQNDLTNDAGIREQYGSIGNFVWDDLNKNGIQDQGEPGVEGVTVKLFKSSDNTQVGSTQTTNASGEYLFDNLPAGSYYVEFSNLPADYAFTTANAGTDDAFDSDANVLTGKTGTIPLAAGQDDLTNDAGIIEAEWDYGDAPASYPTLYASNGARHQLGSGLYLGNGVDSDSDGQPTAGTVGDDEDGTDDEDGVVFSVMPLMRGVTSAIWVTASGQGFLNAWLDFNHDGDWDDAGEQIFAGQALNAGVNLLYITTPVSAVIGDTTYARFRFSSLQQLGVSGDAPDGEVEDYMIEISDPFVSIGDYVWHDLNEDGIQDENEVGIENVTVHLFLVPNTPGVTLPSTVAPDGADAGAAAPNSEVSLAVEVGTDITDADGKYLFERVFTGAGTYYLKFDLPGSDWFISARDQGSDDEKDSDADQVDGTCDLTILVDGEIDLSWDCGMYLREPNCSIGDFVWWDLNQNGLQDEGPGSGIANVTLYLHLGHANGPVIATQVTDENGFYYFMNLRPGAYTVDVVESTLPSTPLPIQLTTGNEPYTYGLSPNEHHRQADFGYYVPEATGIGRRWVIARYQPWFSDTDAGDPMRHWDWSNHGGEADTSIFHGYDSYDADIWTYHILAAWASGIDGFAVDWYGKDSYENPPVLGLLNAADKLYRQYADRGFNFEIAVSYNEHAEEELDKNMEYIGDSLMTHIAYWGHRRGEPRPLFIFDDKQDTLITADAYRVVADSLLPADKFLLWDGTELEVFKPMDVCYPWIQPLHDEWDPAGMEWGETYLDTTYWRMNYLPNPGELWFALGAVWPGLNDREWSFSEDHFMDRQDTLVYHWTWEKVHEYPYPLNMPWCYIETWNDFNQASEIEPSVDHDYYFNVMTRNNARIFKGSLPPDSVGVENPGLIVPQHILQARREALLHPEAADWINARADEALDLFFERKFYEATWLADFAAGIAPKPVSITGVTNTTMTLAWDTTKYANSYNVYYSQHPEAFLPGAYERPVRIRLDDVTTYTIEGLEPGVQYFVAVTAVDTSIGEFTESWFSSSYTGAGVVSAALPARPGLSTGVASALPDKFALHNNYPNPFNPTTTITYDLPRAQHVLLRVLDVTGRQVAVLVDDNRDAGFHSVQFSGAELSTGVYFFQIVTDEFKAVQRMLLMK